LIPKNNLEDLLNSRRISRIRRVRIEDVDPPRRLYNEDLVNHYQMALSSESPFLEFLSYFHILEHFFEIVFNDDLIERVRRQLTDPGFSYRRKKDLQSLIRTVSKSVQQRSDQYVFNELEALKLTLARFISVQELKDKLIQYNQNVYNHYTTTQVAFSDGDIIYFDSSDEDQIVKQISNRIYKTRNSLVHSKDGERSKYTPFKDDEKLSKELPLMRFISEFIIINSSLLLE
jgi:hypothetical protein